MRRKQSGVTLVELMIAVGIVGILAAIAYPNYREYALRGNRTEAKAELLEAAQDLEKCYTRFGSYISANCTAYTDLTDADGRFSEGRRYQVSVAANPVATATTYVLQAVPQGGQVADTKCGTLRLDQTGARTVSASPADPKCW